MQTQTTEQTRKTGVSGDERRYTLGAAMGAHLPAGVLVLEDRRYDVTCRCGAQSGPLTSAEVEGWIDKHEATAVATGACA